MVLVTIRRYDKYVENCFTSNYQNSNALLIRKSFSCTNHRRDDRGSLNDFPPLLDSHIV